MKGNLDGPVIVPNDLDKSRLYTVLNLPEDDDLFMPPKGGPMDQEQKTPSKDGLKKVQSPPKIAFLQLRVEYLLMMNR